MLIDMLFCV